MDCTFALRDYGWFATASLNATFTKAARERNIHWLNLAHVGVSENRGSLLGSPFKGILFCLGSERVPLFWEIPMYHQQKEDTCKPPLPPRMQPLPLRW